MRKLDNLTFHPTSEKIVEILSDKTTNSDVGFFRLIVSYYMAKVASMMRTTVHMEGMGNIPVNSYMINLATSGCVDKDTEYLTTKGWKPISKFNWEDKIAIVDFPSMQIRFKSPIDYIAVPATDKAYKVSPTSGTKLSMMVSPDHKIPYSVLSGQGVLGYNVTTADQFFNKTTEGLKILFNFNVAHQSFVSLNEANIRVQIAVSADGCFNHDGAQNYVRVRVTKKRKIKRMEQLLQAANIQYRKVPDKAAYSFWFIPPKQTKSLQWIWECNQEQLNIVSDEIPYWDGSFDRRTGNRKFHTTIKEDADAVQYAFQASFAGHIALDTQDRRGRVRVINGKEYITKSIDYTVRQTSSTAKYVLRENVTREAMPDGMQYCFTTETGYWLMRKDNFISITGNSGKGRSINILEDQVINNFRDRFLEQTFPVMAIDNMTKLASRKANRNGTDPDMEFERLESEFEQTGPMVFSFDSGTSAAVKQMRQKLLLASTGSMNMEIDEIGSNLLGNMDVLNSFLELYDVGKIKQKLTKHTKENSRSTEVYGSTPTNMLLFGTPTKLLDGAKTEQEFLDMLETGYARRCFFGYSKNLTHSKNYTPEQIYDIFTDTNSDQYLLNLSQELSTLADPAQIRQVMSVHKDVTLKLIEYRQHCERLADRLSDYEEIRKAELKHRYFKTLKMAGVYAFIDKAQVVTEDHLYYAIALAEESGKAFERILKRDRAHARLATYICTIGREVTQADLVEDLPFYKGTEQQKRDMMKMAMAYGYKNNMVIKINTIDDIDFISGDSLPETDINKVHLSYSTDWTSNYKNQIGKFSEMHRLCTAKGYHWVNHHLASAPDSPGGYRSEEHVQPGFDLLVLDIDDGTSVDTTRLLLQEYTYLIHTTKSSTADKNRYRIILPLSHYVTLTKVEYKEFMKNVYNWIPLNVDTGTTDRCRKWETFPGQHWYNQGELLEATKFINKTKKAEELKSNIAKQTNLSSLERWFVMHTESGNRNNNMLRYSLCLVDMGQDFDSVRNNTLALNQKLIDPLSETEILSTIMSTVMKKINERDMQ